MYEHRTHQLLSRAAFLIRVASHALLALLVMTLALGIGILGYHFLGELSWLDALLNPVAKLFAAGYALFSGLAFIGVASLLVAPFAHRLMHSLHLDEQ
jgi:hypothetical protein